MITVREAKQIAKDWVEAESPNIPNFWGAFLTGSILWKNEADPLPSASDVDLKILVDIDPQDLIFERTLRHQNLSLKGITLEPTFNSFQDFSSPEHVLADYRYAAHFTVPNILSDPSGELIKIQKAVARQFAQKLWVVKRIEGARDFTLWGFDALQSGSFPDRMFSLNLASWGIAQIPLHADLRPPTGRKCGILFLDIMRNHGKQSLHEATLEFLGSRSMARNDVIRHLDDLSKTFDRAVEIVRSPSTGDYVNKAARPVVIDGSWELVNDGFHREAMSWISVMRSIVQQTILQDAPEEEQKKYIKQYVKLLAELGLRSEDDFQKRAEDGKQLLENVMQVVMEIVDMNEKIIE
jgi:hypothetical protein